MGGCESTEIPVQTVQSIPRNGDDGGLVVFGDEYVVGSPTSRSIDPPREQATTATAPPPPLVMRLRPHLLSWSGDSFTVNAVLRDGSAERELFRVGGRALSIDQKRVVVDAATNQTIFNVKENFLQLDDYQTIYRGDGDTAMFTVHSGLGNYSQWTNGLHNTKGQPIELLGEMSLFLSGRILWATADCKKIVARIVSPLDWCDFWPKGWERDSYLVEVVPGVDYALILAMVLAYEKMLQTYDDSDSD